MKQLRPYFLSILFSILVKPYDAVANHGPGTTGGGASTQSGETIKEGRFIFSLNQTYTNYQNISREEVEEKASEAGEFDALGDAYFPNASLSYGLAENFEVNGTIGWYSGKRFIDAHREEHGEEHFERGLDSDHYEKEEKPAVSSAVANPTGLTDLIIQAKYRLVKGEQGHLAVVAGGVLPLGRDDVRLSDGEPLEPSSQPGSGRYSALGGLAYSKYLTPNVTMDLSSVYTHRLERVGFQVGHRADTGITFAYRLNETVSEIPQFSLFFELFHQYIGKDRANGLSNPNSGGNTIFIIPGARMGLMKDLGLIIAPAIPVVQDLNGEQLETDFRLLTQLFYRF